MNVAELYAEMLTTTGSMNTQETEKAFLMSLKKVVGDLNVKLKEQIIAPDRITNTDVGFEDYCDNVFHPGVKFYMQRDGGWAQDPDSESYTFYQKQLSQVIASAITANDNFLTRSQRE
jgi:hypothetical protein